MFYKFIVKPGAWKAVPGSPGLEVQGCVAVVRAPSVDQARAALIEWCREEALNSAWVGVADVAEFGEGLPKVIAYAEV